MHGFPFCLGPLGFIRSALKENHQIVCQMVLSTPQVGRALWEASPYSDPTDRERRPRFVYRAHNNPHPELFGLPPSHAWQNVALPSNPDAAWEACYNHVLHGLSRERRAVGTRRSMPIRKDRHAIVSMSFDPLWTLKYAVDSHKSYISVIDLWHASPENVRHICFTEGRKAFDAQAKLVSNISKITRESSNRPDLYQRRLQVRPDCQRSALDWPHTSRQSVCNLSPRIAARTIGQRISNSSSGGPPQQAIRIRLIPQELRRRFDGPTTNPEPD